MGIGAIIGGVGSAIGGIANIFGAQAASKDQVAAEQAAMKLLGEQLGIEQQNFSPFITAGQGAVNQLATLTGSGPGGNPLTAALTKPFQPTMDQLAQTPGYQFTLNQGLKAVQNSAAARGLGASGEALAGAGNYASGLASTTYQQQFQNNLAQNQQTYNMLSGLSGIGVTSATNAGNLTNQLVGQQAQAQVGIGNAQAAGALGTAQGIGQTVAPLSQIPLNYNILSQLSQLPQFGGNGGFNPTASANSILSGIPGVGTSFGGTSLTNINV